MIEQRPAPKFRAQRADQVRRCIVPRAQIDLPRVQLQTLAEDSDTSPLRVKFASMLSPVGSAPGANIGTREPFQASSLCDYFGGLRGPERKDDRR